MLYQLSHVRARQILVTKSPGVRHDSNRSSLSRSNSFIR